MNFLNEIYKKKLVENEKNLKFWDDYLQNLNSLDFSVYSDKLSVPILVPIGNRVLFRGNLKHTNEVTIALGADYFVKCSLKQAEEIRQHRIKVAKLNHETHLKEKEYLENQINSRESFYGDSGKDIIEHCSEEEDKLWREKHKEKLKEYHQNKSKKEETSRNEIDDEELWRRLEELELQEELKNELNELISNEQVALSEDKGSSSFIIKEDEGISLEDNKVSQQGNTVNVAKITHNIPKQTPKLNLLEQVIERQKVLENKLTELKNRERAQTKTESELLSRLDEIEQLEELEDEMDRLDDILDEDQDTTSEEDGSNSFDDSKKPSNRKQSVSFADEDDTNILEITFKHSEVEPSIEPYDSNKGICKPSDIYEAYSHLYSAGTKSILKKSKYACEGNEFDIQDNKQKPELITEEISNPVTNRIIVVNDVIERNVQRTSVATNEEKPMSIYKQRKLQQKNNRVQYK